MNSVRASAAQDVEPVRPDQLLILLIVLALAGAGGAIAIDSKSAWVSILVGTAGLLIGIVAALTLSDWMIRRTRRENWLRVSGQIADLIQHHVVGVAMEFDRALQDRQIAQKRGWQPLRELDDATKHDHATLGPVLRTLVARITDAAADLGRATDDAGREVPFAVASSASLLQAVDPHLSRLRESITTRVLIVADDPNQVSPLLELERAGEDWSAFVRDVLRFATAAEQAWRSAAAALAAAASLFDAFRPEATP